MFAEISGTLDLPARWRFGRELAALIAERLACRGTRHAGAGA